MDSRRRLHPASGTCVLGYKTHISNHSCWSRFDSNKRGDDGYALRALVVVVEGDAATRRACMPTYTIVERGCTELTFMPPHAQSTHATCCHTSSLLEVTHGKQTCSRQTCRHVDKASRQAGTQTNRQGKEARRHAGTGRGN